MTSKLLMVKDFSMRLQFGAFELDSETVRLSKHGIVVPLRDQPLHVLMALVEQPGQIVTREQLQKRLWKDREFGDFEAGLNTAMSRLREVLNDQVESPRFVETVPKRGYRFIAPVTEKAPASKAACTPEAYAAYQRAQYLAKRHTPANITRALEYFGEATRRDPAWAPPYFGASVVHMINALIGAAPPREELVVAEQLVACGAELDRHSATWHHTLGILRMFQWRWTEAAAEFRRAMTLMPSDPHPHMMYAHQCSFLGRHEEALREAHKALHIAPVDSMVNFRLVQCHYFARRYDDTIRCARTTIELVPEFANTYTYLARALVETSQLEEAWTVAGKARALGGGHPIVEGMYGYLAGVTRHDEEATEVLQRLDSRRRTGYSPALPIAWVHLGLGNREAYLNHLELAFEEREPFLASVYAFPGSDRVRGDPRFERLCRRLGLTNYHGQRRRQC